MPFVIVLALVAASVLCLLTWRWLDIVEKVKVEREKAGGDDRAKRVADLDERVTKIERYMEGR